MEKKIPNYKYTERLSALKVEQSSWVEHWRDISKHILPRSGRFDVTDRNKGDKRHNLIYDSTATKCLRILSAGLMSGMSSPARPWFRLSVADPTLLKDHAVKVWLSETTEIMRSIIAKSNIYRMLQNFYEELPTFGTAGAIIDKDFETVVHGQFLTIGQYYISQNHKGKVDTMFREFDMKVHQLVTQFGYENCTRSVQDLHDRGSLDSWVTVVHLIEPRIDRDPTKSDAKNMPFKNIYFERGRENEKLLLESGHKIFRGIFPRWHVSGGDVYGGACPGMEALGDIHQLQHEQLRKGQAIDYKLRPPMQAPASMKNHELSIFPGETSFIDTASGGAKTLFEVNIDLQHLLIDIQDVRERIRAAFYADIMLQFASQDMGRMTAAEVAQRHEEKLLMIGPVMERMHNELHSEIIEIIFHDMLEANLVPPPPESMQGMDLNIEFVSMMAQAQKAVSTNSIDRFLGTVTNLAQIKPTAVQKINEDKIVDLYADALGLDPSALYGDEEVALVRKKMAQAQEQAQKAAAMNQGADTLQKLSNANTQDKNALTDVTKMFSGYSTPQGGQG
jgi:hypothetical protein